MDTRVKPAYDNREASRNHRAMRYILSARFGLALRTTIHEPHMSNDFFSDLMASISERGRNLLRLGPASIDPKQNASDLLDLCGELLSGRGEASGTAVARGVLDRYQGLDEHGRLMFFQTLAQNYGPDPGKMEKAIAAWRDAPSGDHAGELHFASEPQRQELFRRLNRAPGATSELVAMRADLLDLKNDHKDLGSVDRDLVHLLASWFNRGFLRAAPDRLVDAGHHSRKSHSLRSRARNPRLERSAPPHRSRRSPLLRVLSSSLDRRAADLRRGGADGNRFRALSPPCWRKIASR